MESALKNGEANIVEKSKKHLKTSFTFLDSSARCISWHGHDDPNKLIVGGYDGKLILVDINDPFMYLLLHRSRGKVWILFVQLCINFFIYFSHYVFLRVGRTLSDDDVLRW